MAGAAHARLRPSSIFTFDGRWQETTMRSPLLRTEEDGATSVEYGLMVGLIAIVIFGGVAIFGLAVSDLFTIPAGVFSP
jgi:pilus assembly protein Flp/PilA